MISPTSRASSTPQAATATYTFGSLTVNTGAPHSGNSTCAGGWALIVIYESATERLRAINVFDGLDYFYGSALTLTPDGFRVPPANIDGRIAVFTLDGDPGNSTTNNGVDEALRFNGNLLDDGLVPAGSVPTVQQFDGTINTSGVVTSYGVDVDQYDISGLLIPGATSGTTLYSAGADLVLLMAQVVSATSDPAVDLGVTMSHSGNFVAGSTGQYTITVSNAAGMEREDNIVTVTDTLPTGLTFNAAQRHGLELQRRGAGGHLHARADTQCRRFVPGPHADRQCARDGGRERQQHGDGEHAELRLRHGEQHRHRRDHGGVPEPVDVDEDVSSISTVAKRSPATRCVTRSR